MIRYRARFIFSSFLFLALVGCSSLSGSSNDESSYEKTAEGQQGETVLTIGGSTDVLTFDVHNHSNTTTEAVHVNMFNYLVKKDQEQEIIPDLAEAWENINDTTWRFKLKENVTFHNGDPLTSEDVKFSLERPALDSSTQQHANYKQIKEVRIIDDLTVEISTHEPDPVMLFRLSRIGSAILPSKYIEENGWEEFLKNPIGTGPYQIEEWKRDNQLVLKKNEHYFDTQGQWDKVIFRVIPEDSTRTAELLTGGIDIALNVPPTDLDRIRSTEELYVVQGDTPRVMLLQVRLSEGSVTSDPRVREAIDLAIDNQTLVNSILDGGGVPTLTRVTPGIFGAHTELFNQYHYDPERARNLLVEAGYPDGVDITLSSPNGRYLRDKETAELLASMLEGVGFRVKLELLEWSQFTERESAKKFNEVFMIAYANSMFDAGHALDRVTTSRSSGTNDYSNAEVDRLYEAAQKNMNATERSEQFKKIQEIIVEERPQIYLYQMNANFGVNGRIHFSPRFDELLYVDEITLK